MLETIKTNSFFDEKTLNEIVSGHSLFKKLLCEEYLNLPEENIHLQEFQTYNFWTKTNGILEERSEEFRWDRVHVEYQDIENNEWPQPDGKPEFVQFLHHIKSKFNMEEFHYFMLDELNTRLSNYCDKFGRIYYFALYDLNHCFETHCDGRDIKDKRLPIPDNWDNLTREDWHQEDDVNYTRQGLINLDVADPTDGTVMFEQSFPYSVYIDMSCKFGEMPYNKKNKPRIQFLKGDKPYRFGAEIKNFTHKLMNIDDYDEIMEHCFDESVFPHEATYGLSLEKVLTLDNPGTMYTWDCEKFHKVKPFPDTVDPRRRRLTTHFTCVTKES